MVESGAKRSQLRQTCCMATSAWLSHRLSRWVTTPIVLTQVVLCFFGPWGIHFATGTVAYVWVAVVCLATAALWLWLQRRQWLATQAM